MIIQYRLKGICRTSFCILALFGFFNISCVLETQSNPMPTQDEVIAYYRSLPVLNEGRWLVEVKDQNGLIIVVSKLFLGTAYISLDELKQEWSKWSQDEKISFSQALREALYANLDDYLRFIIENGNNYTLSTLALTMLQRLPEDEFIPFILKGIEDSKLGPDSNLLQVLALSKHHRAVPIIKERLNNLIKHTRFADIPEWSGAYNNPAARQAVLCVELLLELGVSQNEISDAISLLLNHPSPSVKTDITNVLQAASGGIGVSP